jgi:DNA-binding SARP family transcriptional activator
METMNSLWHIQLFGGVCARQTTPQGERRINRFRTQSAAALLAYLAYFKGHSHAREILVERIWPDVALDSGRHNLSNALSSLRNQLEPPGVPAGTVIIADRLSVELNPAAYTSDVEVFEQALRQAAQIRTSEIQKMERLARAVDAYTGVFLPDHYQAWITTEQERLAQRCGCVASLPRVGTTPPGRMGH